MDRIRQQLPNAGMHEPELKIKNNFQKHCSNVLENLLRNPKHSPKKHRKNLEFRSKASKSNFEKPLQQHIGKPYELHPKTMLAFAMQGPTLETIKATQNPIPTFLSSGVYYDYYLIILGLDDFKT